jgi:hypothetical protein
MTATATAERTKKSPAAYLTEPMTENQKQFLDFVLAAASEAGLAPKPGAEMAAFSLGVKGAGLYARYQASKREPVEEVAPEPVAAEKPARKPRARKTA